MKKDIFNNIEIFISFITVLCKAFFAKNKQFGENVTILKKLASRHINYHSKVIYTICIF